MYSRISGPLLVSMSAVMFILPGQIAAQDSQTVEPTTAAAQPIGRPGLLSEYLPPLMFEITVMGLQLWQWTGLLLALLGAWVLSWAAAWILYLVLRPVVSRTTTTLDDKILARIFGPLRFLAAVGIFALGSALLSLPYLYYSFFARLEVGLLVVGVTAVALRITDIFSDALRQDLEEKARSSAVMILSLGTKSLKVFVLIMAGLAILQNLGLNVTGLIAGLGVGGLAVALAAQKSLANLFGGVSLLADQPVRVGDFCRFGSGDMGTVEEIGLRSTRVRTLDRTLVTIPNAEFSEFKLENFGKRDRLRLHTILGLRYETRPDQLRHVLADLRKLLIAHPMITDLPARVRFVGFGAHSLDIEVFAYVLTTDYNEFLKVREDIFLRFMHIVEKSGTGFAFPSQTLYLRRDDGLDETLTREAEKEVAEWRDRGELPFPDFAQETVQNLRGTADYPPRGAATST